MAAAAVSSFGYDPQLVDVEPEWFLDANTILDPAKMFEESSSAWPGASDSAS